MLILQNLTEILEALFTVVIKAVDKPFFLDNFWNVLAQSKFRSRIFCEPNVALYDMFEQSCRWALANLRDHHVVEYGADSQESLSGLTQIVQAILIQKNFLNYECGHSLW